MKKSTCFWLVSAFLFLGVIVGFLISPVKFGIGNNSNSNNHSSGNNNCPQVDPKIDSKDSSAE